MSMLDFYTQAASAGVTAVAKQQALTTKKGSWTDGLAGIGSFLGQTLGAYQTAKAPPASVAPAVAPAPASSSMTPTLIIGGAALLGLVLVLRRR